MLTLLAAIPRAADAVRFGQLLKLAVPVPLAVEAVLGMVGQQQLDDRTTSLHGAGGMRLDLHSFGNREGTTRDETALPFDLDDAHPTGSARRQAFDVTKRRDMDADPPDRRQEHFTLFRFDHSTVDFNRDHGKNPFDMFDNVLMFGKTAVATGAMV